jgi:hypothetical protein
VGPESQEGANRARDQMVTGRIASKRFKLPVNPDLSKNATLNNLVRKGRFSDVVLLSWGLVEMSVNGAFRFTLGITTFDDKRKKIIEIDSLQFEDKLQFLKHVGTISKEEYDKIAKFQHERNKLFHAKGMGPWVFSITKEEKQEVMLHAWDAAQTAWTAYGRIVVRMQYHDAGHVPTLHGEKRVP